MTRVDTQTGKHMDVEGVREVEGLVGIALPSATEVTARALLAATELRCQKGGDAHDALACVECERFVNFRPSADRSRVTIRCQWSLDDPVADMMTLPCALVTVAPECRIREADEIARSVGIRHLLVERDGEMVGLVCRCDLVPPVVARETVSDRMSERVVVLDATATLRDAAAVMTDRHVGCLPVVDAGGLCGIVTRGDLRRAGIEETLLGATRCESCGSMHGVRPHPVLEAVEFCLDCLDRTLTPADYDELGAGD